MTRICPRPRLPLLLCSAWLLAVSAYALALPLLLALQPHWHTVRVQLVQWGRWQCWVAVLACVALLLLSRRRHAEHEEPWAQGTLPVWVLGGLLSALVLHYGVLAQWLLQPTAWRQWLPAAGLLLAQLACAALGWRQLWRAPAAP